MKGREGWKYQKEFSIDGNKTIGTHYIYLKRTLISEGWAFIEIDVLVLSSSHHSKWPHGAVIDSVYKLAMTRDFTDSTSRIPKKYSSKSDF